MFLFFITIAQEPDSIVIYKKLKKVADKSKFATLIYNSVFVEPKPQEYPSKPVSKEEKVVNPYIKYENRIIRKVEVKVLDPFGHSVKDTLESRNNFIQRAGNGLHIASRRWIIINKLIFKEGDTLNPLSISESERLLRQAVYVNDARIYISEVEYSHMVDVYVIVHDKWTVSTPVVLTDITSYARFRNENLFGTGNQFEQYIGFTRPDVMNFSGYYNLSNIDNTYISSRLYYETNIDGTAAGLAFDRPFYSPIAEWAGGVSAYKTWKYFPYTDSKTGAVKHLKLNNSIYDMWLGKSFKLKVKNSIFKQSANFVIGERYYINVFDKRPSFLIDTLRNNLNTSTIIGNIGLSVQQFYKEKFIYRFGANEDVPQGLIVQFLYGATENELGQSRYYLGAELARAKHFRFGYLSAVVSYGMFMAKSSKHDITGNFKLDYFSDLFRIGEWYFRGFVNGNLVVGFNKSSGNSITITYEDLFGFTSGNLSGNSKIVLNSETVAYAPYNLIGFRFAPTFLAGCGMIGSEQKKLSDSNLYQGYALALMVRNENLLTSTFQISFGYYPFLPNGKNNVVTYNPVTSFTLRVRAFAVARPEFLSY